MGQQRTSCLLAFLIAFACALAAFACVLAAFFRAFLSCGHFVAFVVSQIQVNFGSMPLHRSRALSSASRSGRWSCSLQMTAHLLGGLLCFPACLLGLLAQLLGNTVAAVGALCSGDAVPQQSGDNAAAVAALGSGDAMLQKLPVADGRQHLHEDRSVRPSAGLRLVLSGSIARCRAMCCGVINSRMHIMPCCSMLFVQRPRQAWDQAFQACKGE